MTLETATPRAATAAITDEVAAFVTATKAADIPKDVAHLGKRSVLDGIGLALAGARSASAPRKPAGCARTSAP
jgi:2-methylcitrate dehydratase PrpD